MTHRGEAKWITMSVDDINTGDARRGREGPGWKSVTSAAGAVLGIH